MNDPAGQVRGWLAEDGQLSDDQVFAGEANMRVQSFVPRQAAAAEADWPSAAFGTDLSVRVGPLPGQITSGETLYPALDWEFTGQPVDFATSIRLIGPDGAIWAQPPDERPSGPMLPASQWAEDQAYRQTLKLPVPAGTPPGQYAVELVVYDPLTGQPWPAQAGDLALTPNGLRLGEVTVRPARAVAAGAARAGDLRPAGADRGDLARDDGRAGRAGTGRAAVAGGRGAGRAARGRDAIAGRRPAASSPGWRRNRWTAVTRRRTGPPASSCATGTPSRCRPTWRRARTG